MYRFCSRLSLAVILSALVTTVCAKNFIINGKPAEKGQFPSIVAIKSRPENVNWHAFCGGTLITERFVLTGAHCLVQQNTKNTVYTVVNVYVGVLDTKDKSIPSITAKRAIPHENFDFSSGFITNHDIGLIELDTPVTNVEPAVLPEHASVTGELVTIAGYGRDANGVVTNTLNYVTMPLLSKEECQQFKPKLNFMDSLICAFESSYGMCFGDSGGPYYKKDTNVLVGVASFGRKSKESNKGCDTNHPSYATEVFHYLEWIREHIKDD